MMDIIFHCSDSRFGNAIMIDGWHAQRGFKNADGIHCGYHLVVLNGQLTATKYNKFYDGLVETGRVLDDDDKFEFDEMAAATLGKNNCVQVCFIGESGKFTLKQFRAGGEIIRWMRSIFGTVKVTQHADHDPVNRKYCAGFTPSQMKVFNEIV